MAPILGTKKPQQGEALSVQEAHTLWRILTDRYTVINHFNELSNFVHDSNFEAYLRKMIGSLRKESTLIEQKLEQYAIPAPKPNAVNQNTVGNSEVVLDQEVAATMFAFLRLDLFHMTYTLKDTFVNDDIRTFLANFTKAALNRIDGYIKYVKAKNWLDMPPQYPSVPPDVDEKIAAIEVFLLWDHLEFRYTNIRLTRLFAAYASDPDFAIVLTGGIEILERQVKQIEEKLLHFGVTLPRPYTPVVPNPDRTEVLEDDFMFNQILRGIKDAVVFHGAMLGEKTLNDDIRGFFMKLTLDEISVLDKLHRYGRAKGWTRPSPKYKAGG